MCSTRVTTFSAFGQLPHEISQVVSSPSPATDGATSGFSEESFGSENNVVNHQVRQVMTDLVCVLDELRTVVGDIKSLVTQIDIVTHRMDKSVSSSRENTRRRASAPGGDRLPLPRETHLVQKSHSHNPTPVGTSKKEHKKDNKITVAHLKHLLEKRILPHFRVDNLRLPSHTKHNVKFVVVPGSCTVSEKKRSSTGHDYVNIVIRGECTTTDSTRPNYVNVDGIGQTAILDEDSCSPLSSPEGSSETTNIPNSESDESNKRTSRVHTRYKSCPITAWPPTSVPDSSVSSSLNSDSSMGSYSGLYEREMEDSLELEVTEYRDILGQNSDLGSPSSRGSQEEESDDYVDWQKQEIDASRKHAEVMAWTRSSWLGKKVYHVSLDHSLGYSESVTDGEIDNLGTGNGADDEQWTTLLPSTLNQDSVNYNWRTIIEP